MNSNSQASPFSITRALVWTVPAVVIAAVGILALALVDNASALCPLSLGGDPCPDFARRPTVIVVAVLLLGMVAVIAWTSWHLVERRARLLGGMLTVLMVLAVAGVLAAGFGFPFIPAADFPL